MSGPQGGPGTIILRGPAEFAQRDILWEDDSIMEWDDFDLAEWDDAETLTIALTGIGWEIMIRRSFPLGG